MGGEGHSPPPPIIGLTPTHPGMNLGWRPTSDISLDGVVVC